MSNRDDGWLGFGVGIIINNPRGHPIYHGTLPFTDGDEVIIIPTDIVNEMFKEGANTIKQMSVPMTPNMYEIARQTDAFPDMVGFKNQRTGQEAKLYLDRRLYFSQEANEIWVRYVSEEKFFAEEFGGLETLTELDDNLLDDAVGDEDRIINDEDSAPPYSEPTNYFPRDDGDPPYDNGDESDWETDEPDAI